VSGKKDSCGKKKKYFVTISRKDFLGITKHFCEWTLLQVQGSAQALMTLATHEGSVGIRMSIPQYSGLFGTISTIARQEGPK